MRRHYVVLFLVALTVFSDFSSAAGVVMYRSHERPNPRDVASILTRSTQLPPGVKTRSIRMLVEDKRELPAAEAEGANEAPEGKATLSALAAASAAPAKSAPAPAAPAAATEDSPSSLALPVQFAFDSARILPAAHGQIDAVAEGIKLAGPKIRVVIEGHTDAIGSAEYNMRLSSQRAEEVRTYLITQHGIEPSRLRVVGMGKLAPLNQKVPTAPENRRVEFRAEA